MANTTSWFPIKYFDKSADDGILFGPALQNEKTSYMYPNERIKKHETVIWVPQQHKTVSLKSYEKAHQDKDIEALSKITKLGIPLDCNFGGCISLDK